MKGQSLTYPPENFLGTFQNITCPRKASHTHIPAWELPRDFPKHLIPSQSITYAPGNFLRTCIYVSQVRACVTGACMQCGHAYMHVSTNALEPTNQTTFFVRLSGARNVDCNDQQEGGNGIDTGHEHSRQLPRCHTGWTCRAECEVFRQLRQHRTQLPRMAGTAAQGFPNRTSSSCHQ